MDEPEYKAEICAKIVDLGTAGKSLVQISCIIDIPRTTLLRWGDEHPEFRTALSRAKEAEQAWWENQAQNNLENREFNANLWNKCVSARFREDYGDPKPRDTDAETAINNALLKSYSNNAAALIAALLEAQRRAGNPVDMGELISLATGDKPGTNGISRHNGNGKA
jgi:hypothetical protein